MNVILRLPDGKKVEHTVPDIEQLMLLLRLVNGVTLDGITYHIQSTDLIVNEGQWSVSVTLYDQTQFPAST
ncbi:hypothetical protein [Cohnella kolymensis]|uniref:hypothetical protein n=1 Tax=Cohnella kolymensis TaxID=1590652 RepID=UPI00126A4508|nr:hypothetical protein [Cohnella kolymensis]